MMKKGGIGMNQENSLPQGVTIDDHGMMRWVYEMNMWKNPTVLITIGKVLLIASLAPSILMFFLTSFEDGLMAGISVFFQIEVIIIGIILGLLIIAYPLVSVINGGKYCVVFEMNAHGINHIQIQKQFKKNQVLAMITTVAGALSGSPQTAGAGLMAASRQHLYSPFSSTKKLVLKPKRHVIYINEILKHNQIYANDAQYDFVANYIKEHVPKKAFE